MWGAMEGLGHGEGELWVAGLEGREDWKVAEEQKYITAKKIDEILCLEFGDRDNWMGDTDSERTSTGFARPPTASTR